MVNLIPSDIHGTESLRNSLGTCKQEKKVKTGIGPHLSVLIKCELMEDIL